MSTSIIHFVQNFYANNVYIMVFVPWFLVGAFRRKTQTIVVTFLFLFFQDQRSDRFYKLDKLASTNCHINVTSTDTWHRG